MKLMTVLRQPFDIHPEGSVVKTEPAYEVKPEDIPKSYKGWKIASYISFLVNFYYFEE